MSKFLGRIISALLFLTASTKRLAQADPQRFARPAAPTMIMSVVWGLILAALWSLTFHLAWSGTLNWMVPSLVCAAAMTFGPYRRGALALIQTIIGPKRRGRWVGMVLLAVGVSAILNYAFRQSDPDWPTQLSQQWAWLWPRAICRVLLLAPVWGAWSMVVLGQFYRPDGRTDPPARSFAETTGPIASAICLAVPLAGSLLLLSFLSPWRHFVPPAAAVATALAGGTLIVRLRGGLSRDAMLAVNFLTQMGFFTAYLTVR